MFDMDDHDRQGFFQILHMGEKDWLTLTLKMH